MLQKLAPQIQHWIAVPIFHADCIWHEKTGADLWHQN